MISRNTTQWTNVLVWKRHKCSLLSAHHSHINCTNTESVWRYIYFHTSLNTTDEDHAFLLQLEKFRTRMRKQLLQVKSFFFLSHGWWSCGVSKGYGRLAQCNRQLLPSEPCSSAPRRLAKCYCDAQWSLQAWGIAEAMPNGVSHNLRQESISQQWRVGGYCLYRSVFHFEKLSEKMHSLQKI
jgi:hypothetical protein